MATVKCHKKGTYKLQLISALSLDRQAGIWFFCLFTCCVLSKRKTKDTKTLQLLLNTVATGRIESTVGTEPLMSHDVFQTTRTCRYLIFTTSFSGSKQLVASSNFSQPKQLPGGSAHPIYLLFIPLHEVDGSLERGDGKRLLAMVFLYVTATHHGEGASLSALMCRSMTRGSIVFSDNSHLRTEPLTQ